jgi:hypothetical protein
VIGMTKTLVIALLLFAMTAHADSADLGVQADTVPVIRAGAMFYIDSVVHNAGPDVARNVVVTIKVKGFPDAQLPCPDGRCPIGDLQPGASHGVVFSQRLPDTDVTITFEVTVTSETPDPHPEDNSVTRTIVVSTGPDLSADLQGSPVIDPGLPYDAILLLYNAGLSAAHHVIVTLDLPDGSAVLSLPSNCTASSLRVTCTLDVLAANTNYLNTTPMPIKLRAPPRYEGGLIPFELRMHADEADFDVPFDKSTSALLYRTFLVTTSADDGAGSLRAAIAAANAADCYLAILDGAPACAIQFNIGEASARPWKTIRLRSPLPFIGAYSLRIDGATQTAFSGVTNPDGPPIEISGGGTVDGDGLNAGTCSVSITHLAINGFLGNGISLRNFNSVSPFACGTSIQGNYIGTDPTGSVAVPNNRGIGIIQSNSPFFFGSVISGNVLSGNIRSGLFAEAGIWDIRENRIGVKAHSDEPLPNGASGIYLDRGLYRSEVSFNVIAFNREMGIAVDPGTLYTEITSNRIWGNGGLAIDDGLDGPSVSVMGDNGPINVPLMTSAVYDPAKNQTTIRGSAPGGEVEVFASDAAGPGGAGDAQRLLSYSNGGDFALTVPGDLRGQWVSATVTVFGKKENAYPDVFSYLRTTELSRALQVH